jgi:hypothetical protein
MSLALAVCYAAVAALLLNLNIGSGWSFQVKAGAIALVSALYGVTWFGIIGMEGWASEESMPAHFQLQWVAIDEPDPQENSEGAIYFWIRHFDDEARTTAPRAYVLPFDDEDADSARDALTLLQEGKRVEGRITMQSLDPDRERIDEELDASEDPIPPGGGPADPPSFEFREMAPPDLPPKPAPGA